MPDTSDPRYRSVTPRIVVEDLFGAMGAVDPGRPVELRIGDSLIMVSSTSGGRDAFPAFLYVYVDDADEVYERAVRGGATTLEEPLDTPYGDRRAMVRDPFGNVFQIATHIVES